jgi:hypothetical protein
MKIKCNGQNGEFMKTGTKVTHLIKSILGRDPIRRIIKIRRVRSNSSHTL